MIERIVENWLTKVNEKSFQKPFCQMLIGEGFKVIHLSRHGSFEEGKDILAIAPDGTPCAFQLKGSEGGKISQKEWAKYYDQIIRLVEIPIKHPSIDESRERKVFFVTNGELDEEVRVQISNQNSDWKRRQCPELGAIVKGELLTRFVNIQNDLWPTQLQSEKEFLELYLADGTGYLDKAKYARFLESLILSNDTPTRIEAQRILASAAIFASYALSPYTLAENFVAIVEGWTIFIASAIAFAEKQQLDERFWQNTVLIAEEEIEDALSDLYLELKTRKDFVTGNALVDAPFYRGRLTWLSGFISAYLILSRYRTLEGEIKDWFSHFFFSNQKLLLLWGEAATPQFLAIYWALRTIGYTQMADRLLFALFKSILEKATDKKGIPDPYHPLGEIVLSVSGLSDELDNENFSGRSYSLDSLIQLLTRREYRGVLAENWKQLTLLHFAEFEPDNAWQYCTWHCEDGIFHETMLKTPQSWTELVNQSSIANVSKIPNYYQKNPAMLLIFLIVYPQRLFPDVVKFLDDSIFKIMNDEENI